MTVATVENTGLTQNPLDVMEEIVIANDWPFERLSSDEMVVECKGRWTSYRLFFYWQDDVSAMQFSCQFDMKVLPSNAVQTYELLARVNERMWLGHFDVEQDDGIPTFRHTTLLRGHNGASVEMLEDMVDIALNECERFYPAFHLVISEGHSAPDAISAAILDTVAEA